MKKRLFIFCILALVILTIFHSWFLSGVITGGDFWPYYRSMFYDYQLLPPTWAWNLNMGLGQFGAGFLWNYVVLSVPITVMGSLLHLDWAIIERVSYLYPLLLLLIIASTFLYYKLFPKNDFFFVSPFIFSLNTYSLLLIGGGQIFIALAYFIAPITLFSFIRLINKEKPIIKDSFLAGLFLSLQFMLDLRIGYIMIVVIAIYWLMYFLFAGSKIAVIKLLSYVAFLPGCVVFCMHSFWIIPVLIFHQNPIQNDSSYVTTAAVQFFSFAKFENTLSLLHPNWPENIFGKVSFMKPEYLFLPIIAYSSLLFINNKPQKTRLTILFFCFLGLVGAFLAKGTNDPFGNIYTWMFGHIPGFVLFRDSTKFYLLIALSYCILIPFSISEIYTWIEKKYKKLLLQHVFILGVIMFFLFLIRPAIFNQLTGTLQQHIEPQEYVRLERFLNKPGFSRTLWLPSLQRYGFFSSNHPPIAASDFYQTTNIPDMVKELKKQNSEKILQDAGVKYVIIPLDTNKEIFIEGRIEKNQTAASVYMQLLKIPWLHEIPGFGKIKLFEVASPKDHFWILHTDNKSGRVSFVVNKASQYTLTHILGKKGDLVVFSEGYDPKWIAKDSKTGIRITSQKYEKLFNSFPLPKDGTYDLNVYYAPQLLENTIIWISLVSSIIVIIYVGFSFSKQIKVKKNK